jgi:DnaK suppressor protein
MEVDMATALRSGNNGGTPPKNGKTAKPAATKTRQAKLELDPDAPFMGKKHQAYFREKLQSWKEGISEEVSGTREQLREGPIREPDATDRASSETDWSIELRRRDRQRKLVTKIDAALSRLESGEYGYCIVTGEPISLARLDARPIATMTIEAQESHERKERLTRDE